MFKTYFLERFNQNHSGGWARKVLMVGADMVQDKNTVADCQQNSGTSTTIDKTYELSAVLLNISIKSKCPMYQFTQLKGE